MSADGLKKEICQYRKLVKAQRKVLESLSQKVVSQEKLADSLKLAKKKLENLKQQLEYYQAKGRILQRQFGKGENISKLIFEEIQRKRANRTLEKWPANLINRRHETGQEKESSGELEDDFDRLSSEELTEQEQSTWQKETVLAKTRSEVDNIVEELTNIRESEDFTKVARRLLNLRKMLNNS